ncbi:hypothetical protein LBMAG56_28220 [Verrucomicrobiota bacterium]|nr:hypothetical protein LBMAG56_28220 [Verrucomicrobiota bacterium]
MRIQTESISKNFFGTPALVDVSLDLAPGQLVAVLGLNGAGKTTLLRCLSGLATPDAGRVLLDGAPLDRESEAQRRRLHFLPDFPALFPTHSILRNVSAMMRLYGRDEAGAEQRVVAWLEEFDLLPLIRKPLAALSRGQAYKAAFVGLLAADPEVWLLDEPFASGMDPLGLNAFRTYAQAAVQRGRTILYTTQILDLVERFSDRVLVLDHGRLAANAPLAELRRETGGMTTALEALFRELRAPV